MKLFPKYLTERSLLELGVVLLLFIFTGVLCCLYLSDFQTKRHHSDQKFVTVVSVDTRSSIFNVDEKFLSVALDTAFLGGRFQNLDRRQWHELTTLSGPLSPAYLRVGGTKADVVVFNKTIPATKKNKYSRHEADQVCTEDDDDSLCISPTDYVYLIYKDWMKLIYFSIKSNTRLIFDLNVLLRNNNHWDYTNAEELIQFTAEKNIMIDWQLGNEPNSFHHVFNVTISGEQLGEDYIQLKKLLNKYYHERDVRLIGPEVTRPVKGHKAIKYLDDFLNIAKDVVTDISWHQYYLNSRVATLDDFLNVSTFNLLSEEITKIKSTIVRHYAEQSKPIWLSETSSSYGGGAVNLSDTFAGSFLWVDKLGLSARQGVSVVIRQDLFDKVYSLIDTNFNPTPDWWISVLYKNLVGRQVLNVFLVSPPADGSLRLYAHCSKKTLGNLVLFGVNIADNIAEIIFTEYKNKPIKSYILTASYIQSKNLLLNGNLLLPQQNYNNFDDIFVPKRINSDTLVMPQYSVAFWEIPGEFKVCL